MRLRAPYRMREIPVRLGRIFFVILVALSILNATARSQGISVLMPGTDSLRVNPGEIIGIPVVLRNDNAVETSVRLMATLPGGWRQVIPLPYLTLSPGKQQIQLLVVAPPQNARKQLYTVSLSLASAGPDSQTHGPYEVSVRVNAVRKYELHLIDAPSYAVGGTDIPYMFEVRNLGNDTLTLRVYTESSLDAPITGNPGSITLPPGGLDRIRIRLAAPKLDGVMTQHTLAAIIVPANGGERKSITVVTDIVSGATTARAPRFEFPLYARVRTVGEGPLSGLQGEISGIGSFREDGRDRFELLARSPQTQTISALGLRDEYRARYREKGFEVYAGDWNYSLSPLTEVGRYGIGLGGRASVGEGSVGGFVNQTRIAGPVWKQSGVYARYPVSEKIDAGVNVLQRAERVSSTTTTVSASADPFQYSKLEVEAGASSSGGTHNRAYALRLNGYLPFGSYDLRLLDAEPGFSGYYRDVRVSSLSLSGFATRDVRLELQARSERRNTLMDTLRGTAPRTDFVQVGGGISNHVSLSFRASNLSDPLSLIGLDRREELLQLRSSYELPWGLASAYVDYGDIADRRGGGSYPSRRLATSFDATPFPGNSVSVSAEYSDAPDFFTSSSTKRTSFTVSVASLLFPQTQAHLSFFASNATGGQAFQYTSIDASVSHVFPWGHNARLMLRRNSVHGAENETAFAVEYGMPLEIPMGKRRSEGVLTGRVVDTRGKGLAHVLLTVGQTATITGDDGRFAFSALPAGEQHLSVDRGTLGIELVPTVAMPLQLMIVGGEESNVTIRVAAAGRLEGYVNVFSEPEEDTGLAVVPFDPNFAVVLELNSGVEILRRQTDPHGRFYVGDIRPGHWSVTFIPVELPPGFRLEKEKHEIEVTEGGIANVTLRILPRKKAIRVLQQGGVLQPESGTLQSELAVGNFIIRLTPSSGGYSVLAQLRDERDAALSDQQRMRLGSTVNVLIERVERAGQKPTYRAIAGPFRTLDEAKAYCMRLL